MMTCMTAHWHSNTVKLTREIDPNKTWTEPVKIQQRNQVTSQLGYLAPMSEANNTIFQAIQVENSLKKPKEHIYKQFK